MNIITGIYNKVLNFFQTEKDEGSRDVASNRLKLVLMHDRTKLDNLTLERMRFELIDVISKYIEIDKEALDLNLAGEGSSIALMLNIPVIRPKTPEEIELAMQEAEQKAKERLEAMLEQEKADEEADDADEDTDSEESDTSEMEEETELPIEEDEVLEDDEAIEVEQTAVEEPQKKHVSKTKKSKQLKLEKDNVDGN